VSRDPIEEEGGVNLCGFAGDGTILIADCIVLNKFNSQKEID